MTQNNKNYKNFKGFDLFNDIADMELRIRNQAVVLTNIAQDNIKEKKISAKGASLILGYFGLIDPNDRADVQAAFKANMLRNGFAL